MVTITIKKNCNHKPNQTIMIFMTIITKRKVIQTCLRLCCTGCPAVVPGRLGWCRPAHHHQRPHHLVKYCQRHHHYHHNDRHRYDHLALLGALDGWWPPLATAFSGWGLQNHHHLVLTIVMMMLMMTMIMIIVVMVNELLPGLPALQASRQHWLVVLPPSPRLESRC